MTFRPYPILTVLSVAVFAALIALGVWQLQRAQWKAGLIAEFEKAEASAPASLEEALCGSTSPLHRLVVSSKAAGPAVRVFGQDKNGDAGWRHFQAAPGCAAGDPPVLVETGWEPQNVTGQGGLSPVQPVANKHILLELPPKPMIASPNSPATNEWIWFDPEPMAKAIGQPAIDRRFILTALDGLPAYLTTTPPDRHIGYAITWFGLAAALLLVYAAFHMRAGRLRFTSGKAAS